MITAVQLTMTVSGLAIILLLHAVGLTSADWTVWRGS